MERFDLHKKVDFVAVGDNSYVKCDSIIGVYHFTKCTNKFTNKCLFVRIKGLSDTPIQYDYNSYAARDKDMEKLFNSLQQCRKREKEQEVKLFINKLTNVINCNKNRKY